MPDKSKTKIRPANEAEINDWDNLIKSNPDGGDLFQTITMTELKAMSGWKPHFMVYETSFGSLFVVVLIRSVPIIGKIAYIMRGPGVTNQTQLREVVGATKSWDKKLTFIKYEPPIPDSDKLLARDLVKVRHIQPNAHTVLIDLSQSEDQILTSFRQRARREIKAAVKDGIIVRPVELTDDNIDRMYRLYQTTSSRAGFFIRAKSYYVHLWKNYSSRGQGQLFFAYEPSDGDNPIAGAFVCMNGKKALYKDGGSVRQSGKHFAHLLQWEIMKYLKQHSVSSYDLHGVPPSDEIENKNHPLAGLAIFKLSFSNTVTDYVGAYDQVLRPVRYKLWRKFIKRLYTAYLHRVKGQTLF